MKARLLIVGACLLLNSCASSLVTGQHVPIEGKGTPEAKTLLAKRVLAALPEAQVRARLQERFPRLTPHQLERVHVTYTTMEIHHSFGDPEAKELQVHLVVEIDEDQAIHPLSAEIKAYVASLFRAELRRVSRA